MKKEAKSQKKEQHLRDKLQKRSVGTGNGNYNYLLKMKQDKEQAESSGRKYSVFSEESSSLSGDFEQEQLAPSGEGAGRNGRF